MNSNLKLREELSKGDFNNDAEDEYIKMLDAHFKKKLFLKVGLGTFYFLILMISLLLLE